MNSPADSDFLGQGWAFPVATSGGKVQLAAGADDIRQALLIILQTAPGERVMLPAFGCRINELVFAAGNATAVNTNATGSDPNPAAINAANNASAVTSRYT